MKLTAPALTFILIALTAALLPAEQIIHRVDDRETLFGLSLMYNTTVAEIKRLNNLDSELIRKDQELIIPSEDFETLPEKREASINTYRVKRGDTLSEIASSMNLEQKQLIQLNNLSGNTIRIDQILKIPGKASAGDYYTVQSGDTLSKISLLFDISQDQIRLINNMSGDSLRAGQKVSVAPLRPMLYIAEKGDSLWDIANNNNLSTEDLMSFNNMENPTIFPGQEIKLYPYTVSDFEMPETEPEILMASYKEEPLKEYRNYEDGQTSQPSKNYAETRLENPVTNYNQAREILADFDRSISRERRLSNDLAGYTIVLDPGHGGLDPGAIVPSKNGNGETVYVVEDEYAYDISLMTYRLLKLHGADVTMTIISPNHQIRSSANPSSTFVNMKNEVYNLSSLNRKGDDSCWPVGGSRGLRKRVEIAEAAFSGAEREKTLYLSIHADNSPEHGTGTMVLYTSENESGLEHSKDLAESLIPYLGASSTTGRQNLAVLRDNPAHAEVLIEIRNLHYPGNSWAIRYDKLREQDAEFITEGILSYAEGR